MLTAFSFSQDGSRLATVSPEDQTARIWNLKTAKQVTVLKANAGYVTNAVFSHDGGRVVTSHWDGTVRIWDTNTGAALFNYSGARGARVGSIIQCKRYAHFNCLTGPYGADLGCGNGHTGRRIERARGLGLVSPILVLTTGTY